MIDNFELVKKFGKKGARDFMLKHAKGKSYKDLTNADRWGKGLVWTQICEHNKLTISDGKETGGCENCNKKRERAFYTPKEIEPHFNMGLGGYVESRSDLKRSAKAAGMIHIGDDKIA